MSPLAFLTRTRKEVPAMIAEVYGSSWCGYCRRAKSLLEARGIEYEEFLVDEDISREELSSKIGKPVLTVPQIFLDGEHIGGYTELAARLGVSG
jgi:glutaredoxin